MQVTKLMFYFRTTDVTGEVELPSGTEMVMPGDDAKFKVKLITPIAMNEKLNFAIREGGRTVGTQWRMILTSIFSTLALAMLPHGTIRLEARVAGIIYLCLQ